VSASAKNPAAQPDAELSAEELRALYEAKVRAELAAADALAPGSDAVPWRGALLSRVALVKGLAGPAEVAGGAALSGPDGDAASKALEALGYDVGDAFFTLSRPEPGIGLPQRAERLRAQIEAVDPAVVLALDSEAAEDLAVAFGAPPLAFGRESLVLGRRFVAVDGLEASLGDDPRKRRVWSQLKAAAEEGPVY